MYQTFSSRKFLLFLLVIIVATGGWVYALVYKPEQLATISTFLLALLGAYGGANLAATHLANKLQIATASTPAVPAAAQAPAQTPPVPVATPMRGGSHIAIGATGDEDNG